MTLHRTCLLATMVLLSTSCTPTVPGRRPSQTSDGPRITLADGGVPPRYDQGTRWPALDQHVAPKTDQFVPPPPPPDFGLPKPDTGNPAQQLTAAELDLFNALNKARADKGLPPVVIDWKLMCAARKHSLDVGGNGSCGHVGSDGSWPWDRAQACGFPQQKWTVNEIAAGPGFSDGADAIWGWSNSPGHWAAIVHTQAKSVGVGVFKTCFIALFDCCVAGS